MLVRNWLGLCTVILKQLPLLLLIMISVRYLNNTFGKNSIAYYVLSSIARCCHNFPMLGNDCKQSNWELHCSFELSLLFIMFTFAPKMTHWPLYRHRISITRILDSTQKSSFIPRSSRWGHLQHEERVWIDLSLPCSLTLMRYINVSSSIYGLESESAKTLR